MDELREWAKGYIQMEEMSTFKIEVRKVKQKWDKREGGTTIDSHKLDKRHKSDKCQPLLRRPKHEC